MRQQTGISGLACQRQSTKVTIVMSDRGIPKSYRTMHGFGSHTYSLINENDERVWVKIPLGLPTAD